MSYHKLASITPVNCDIWDAKAVNPLLFQVYQTVVDLEVLIVSRFAQDRIEEGVFVIAVPHFLYYIYALLLISYVFQ